MLGILACMHMVELLAPGSRKTVPNACAIHRSVNGGMVSTGKPRVSIGMPVFNGERYLEEALHSILAQTYQDFELIISDNASTDSTWEICQAYAAKDRRIRCLRAETNLGASENFNRVFELSSGEYFKWAAHDDLCAPQFLERCVEALDRDPSLVLCYARTSAIDEDGVVLRHYRAKPNLGSPAPHIRFHECICVSHPQVAVFGVIRASALRETRLIGRYAASDRPLLGEHSLLGRLYEIPENLFFYRNHPQQSWAANPTRHSEESWYDPARAGKITFPHWRLLREHFLSVRRASLNWRQKTRCYLVLAWWIRRRWRYLAKNLALREP
jgi:glycosyltransferase involved in cell wall biosynthesis